MNKVSFTSAVLSIVLLAYPGGTHAVHAQPDTDAILKAMPKVQKDFFVKLLDLSKQELDAKKLKNAVAKKEALDKVTKDSRELLANINDTLSKDGAKDWTGSASVSSQTLAITYKLKQESSLLVTIYIPTKGMTKDVIDVVKKLDKGDQVRFTIDANPKTPAKISHSGGSLGNRMYSIQAPTQLLKSLSVASPK